MARYLVLVKIVNTVRIYRKEKKLRKKLDYGWKVRLLECEENVEFESANHRKDVKIFLKLDKLTISLFDKNQ
jgi:hypothetical protein